ncbi:MAG: methyltransferase [Geobacter sp.]|nr:methyltransferase [Geobacter sp.]
MRGEETIDELRGFDLRVIQPKHGYRFSVDPLLLCDFAAINPGERAVDLGTGSGVIPLVLARKADGACIVGVEKQEEMTEFASRNVSLNALGDRISILHADIMSLKKLFPVSSFDLVLANPPFRSQATGRVSPRAGRDLCRHESTATLADFLSMAKYLAGPAGRICFIYLAERLPEFMSEACALNLSPIRLRLVHGKSGAVAKMFLIEFVKGRKGELKVLPPLFVYGEGCGYSQEMEKIYEGRCFHKADSPAFA